MPQQTIVVPAQAAQGASRVQVVVPGPEAPGPTEVYEAFRAQRSELRDQLETLEDAREGLAEQLMNPMVEGANKTGLEARIATIDQRIAEVEKSIAAADADVARAAAVPGAVIEEPPPERNGPPEAAWVVLVVFTIFVLFPIAIAYARRLWKRAGTAVLTLPAELYERMTRLEQSVDAVAVEVERIGEGQRFMTRVLSEQREPQPVPLNAPESAAARR